MGNFSNTDAEMLDLPPSTALSVGMVTGVAGMLAAKVFGASAGSGFVFGFFLGFLVSAAILIHLASSSDREDRLRRSEERKVRSDEDRNHSRVFQARSRE